MDYAYEAFVNDLVIERATLEAVDFRKIGEEIKNIFDKLIQFVKRVIRSVTYFVTNMKAIDKAGKLMNTMLDSDIRVGNSTTGNAMALTDRFSNLSNMEIFINFGDNVKDIRKNTAEVIEAINTGDYNSQSGDKYLKKIDKYYHTKRTITYHKNTDSMNKLFRESFVSTYIDSETGTLNNNFFGKVYTFQKVCKALPSVLDDCKGMILGNCKQLEKSENDYEGAMRCRNLANVIYDGVIKQLRASISVMNELARFYKFDMNNLK